MGFSMTNLTRNLSKFSCQNCHTKTHVTNLMHFQGEMVHCFLKNEALRGESVKFNHIHVLSLMHKKGEIIHSFPNKQGTEKRKC